MKKLKKISTLSVVTLTFLSCSVNKDKFLNRNYNAIKAKYNVLFNGEQAFEKGLKNIRENHQDNFWKRLEIEPITFDETKVSTLKLKSTDEETDEETDKEETTSHINPFDRAEEKAVKAIQKYSMEIGGYEKNRQIDDAYFLLGKSRYYTQRFIPAIEAFNNTVTNYSDTDLNYEIRIWRAKANTRLGNEETAIQTMNLLLDVVNKKEKIPKRIKEQAHTAMAMAYAETDTIQKVIEHLTKATQTFENKEQSARNMFILGQIYSELDRKDSARVVFQKLADTRKAPEKYRIHANIELAKNTSKKETTQDLIKRFKKLAKNSNYYKYQDELNYQVGVLEENRGNIEQAIKYYKKSLNAKNGSEYQKTYTYERLGGIYFKKANYLLAGSYYDSVMKVVPKEFKDEARIRGIKRKNRGLISLKKYESIVKNNDSILQVVAMPKEEQVRFFENYIEKIKKQDEEKRQQLLNSQNFGNSFGGGTSVKNSANRGKWYFYNTQSKEFGKSEFKRVWGNRPLKDNWRLSDKSEINLDTAKENKDATKNESRYQLATYIDAIPKDPKKITSLKTERNNALYQLGLIYKEQFKNTNLAIKNLERLQKINKNKELELPIHYHLYQAYTGIGDNSKANSAKKFILRNYPYSQFADIIKSPNKKPTTEKKEDEIEAMYKKLYYLYKNNQYKLVVNQINSFSQTINKSTLIPKFALLRALSIGKYQSKKEYKKALEFVAFSYSNTNEGKKAKEIINILK